MPEQPPARCALCDRVQVATAPGPRDPDWRCGLSGEGLREREVLERRPEGCPARGETKR